MSVVNTRSQNIKIIFYNPTAVFLPAFFGNIGNIFKMLRKFFSRTNNQTYDNAKVNHRETRYCGCIFMSSSIIMEFNSVLERTKYVMKKNEHNFQQRITISPMYFE